MAVSCKSNCYEKFGASPAIAASWWLVESQKGSHMKLVHPEKMDFIIFPNHGSKEIGTELEKKIKKQAGL